MTPFILAIDELSYYAYHDARYDRGFLFLAELCWQLNNQKWIPVPLNDSFQKLENVLSVLTIDDWSRVTPKRILAKGETMYFLNNARDYWLSNAPLTIFTFSLLMLLYKRIQRYCISRLLLGFSTASYLASSLIGDNVQYLSFRAFQQLRCLTPRSPLEYLSIILAVTCLFVVVTAVGCLYLMIWSGGKCRFEVEHYKERIFSYAMLNMTIAGGCLNGFAHAYFDSPKLQLPCLLCTCLAILFVNSKFSSFFKSKRTFCIYSLNIVFRILLNITLLAEVWIDELATSIEVDSALSNVTCCIAYCLCFCLVLYELLIYLKSVVEFINKKVHHKR